jgi:hypothetical protein
VYLTMVVETSRQGEETYVVLLAPGQDVDTWHDEMAAAAGTVRWRFDRCPRDATRYDEVSAAALHARWPSGLAAFGTALVGDGGRCDVVVAMPYPTVRPEDVSYAARWGEARLEARGLNPGTIEGLHPDIYRLDVFVSANPAVFYGLVLRDIPTLVLAPGVRAADWEERIREAAGVVPWATTQCPSVDPAGDCGGLFPRTERHDEQAAAWQAYSRGLPAP